MTEDEAKTKWCPFVRAIILGAGPPIGPANRAVNESGEGHKGASCIGTACMAWRVRHQWRWIATAPGRWSDGNIAPNDTQEVRQQGYCGLAGAPQ